MIRKEERSISNRRTVVTRVPQDRLKETPVISSLLEAMSRGVDKDKEG